MDEEKSQNDLEGHATTGAEREWMSLAKKIGGRAERREKARCEVVGQFNMKRSNPAESHTGGDPVV